MPKWRFTNFSIYRETELGPKPNPVPRPPGSPSQNMKLINQFNHKGRRRRPLGLRGQRIVAVGRSRVVGCRLWGVQRSWRLRQSQPLPRLDSGSASQEELMTNQQSLTRAFQVEKCKTVVHIVTNYPRCLMTYLFNLYICLFIIKLFLNIIISSIDRKLLLRVHMIWRTWGLQLPWYIDIGF